MPDFEKVVGEIWDSLAVDGRPEWHNLSPASQADFRAFARAVHADAIESAAKVAETLPSRLGFTADRMFYGSEVAQEIATRIRALAVKEAGDGA